jgi:hypothetical protein
MFLEVESENTRTERAEKSDIQTLIAYETLFTSHSPTSLIPSFHSSGCVFCRPGR